MKKKATTIKFTNPIDRRVGLLADKKQISTSFKAWDQEDNEKLTNLCELYDIEPSPTMHYDLALTLARILYPKKKKSGRKAKWNYLNKGALVVEIERLIIPDNKSKGASWAANILARSEPWKSFLETKDSKISTPDPREILRTQYFNFKEDNFAKMIRNAFKMYQYEDKIQEWDQNIYDFVRNTISD